MRSTTPTPPDLSNIQERSSAELGELAESLRNFRQGMQSELIGRALRGDKEAEQVLETHSFGSKALYTGTFDPFTNGHLDVALRAASLFDELTIAVGVNPAKTPLFQPRERVQMIQETVRDYPNIRVISYQDGSAHRAELESCNIIIRGVREVTDFTKEISEANLNRQLAEGTIETLLLPSDPQLSSVSSSVVKALTKAFYGISDFVPAHIGRKLRNRVAYEALTKRFIETVQPLSKGSVEDFRKAFGQIADKYLGTDRHHHALWHLHEMFLTADRVPDLARHPALAIAIIGHDAIYDVSSKENEELSASFTTATLQELGIPDEILREAERLILLSKEHKAEPSDRLGQVFCDLDFAILSAPRSRYAEYAAGIASEYAPTVGAEAYNRGRINFLKETLKRDTFFYSPEEFGLSNIRARQNMAAEKEKLEALSA